MGIDPRVERRLAYLEKHSHKEQKVVPAVEVTRLVNGLNTEILDLRKQLSRMSNQLEHLFAKQREREAASS